MSSVGRWLVVTAVAVVGAGLGVGTAALLAPWPQATPLAGSTSDAPEPSASATPTPTPSVTADATGAPVATPTPLGIDLAAHSVDDPSSVWVVVNKVRPLAPQSFSPDDLVSVSPVPGSGQLRTDAAKALRRMYDDAVDAGARFSVSTAYRSYSQQQGIYQTYVNERGRDRADRYSARPGYSEHQTGLAFDAADPAGCHLKPCYGDTDSGRWLAAHAHEYGFIVRYSQGQEAVTGYAWEPWHLRFVGVELATYMEDNGIRTMEEVFGLDPAPDYED